MYYFAFPSKRIWSSYSPFWHLYFQSSFEPFYCVRGVRFCMCVFCFVFQSFFLPSFKLLCPKRAFNRSQEGSSSATRQPWLRSRSSMNGSAPGSPRNAHCVTHEGVTLSHYCLSGEALCSGLSPACPWTTWGVLGHLPAGTVGLSHTTLSFGLGGIQTYRGRYNPTCGSFNWLAP